MRAALLRLLARCGLPVRAVRVPTRLQFQTTECGVAALAMVLEHHGRHVPMEELRAATGVSRDCVNAAEILRAVRQHGLVARAFTVEPGALEGMALPVMAHLRFIHFVVIEGHSRDHVLINDPYVGRTRIPRQRFDEAFTGVVLTFSPGPQFEPQPAPAAGLRAWWRDSTAGTRACAVGAVTAGIGAWGALAAGIAAFAATGAMSDAATALSLHIALLVAQQSLLQRLQARLPAERSRRLLEHLLRLPASFHAYRDADRLVQVVGDAEAAARLVAVHLLPAATRLAGSVAALAVLGWLAPAAGIAVAAAGLAAVSWMLAREYFAGDAAYGDSRITPARAAPGFTLPLHDVERQQLGGRPPELAQAWLGQWASTHEKDTAAALHDASLRAACAASMLAGAGATLLLMPAALAPLGVLLALIAALAWSDFPVLLAARRALPPLLQPADDVLAAKAPVADASTAPTPIPPAPGLALQAVGLRFGFSRTRAPLLDGIDVEIASGEQLGLTGPAGGGKSTLAALLAGRLEPWSGELRRPLQADGGTQRVAWIDRATFFFFEGSVRENLCLWRDVPQDQLARAVSDAMLDDVLAARPGGLDSLVEPGARNFSGGQRQRLEIARALLQEPQLLVLDEAIEGIEVGLELRLRSRLRERGCTLVIVSHRAGTLAACDRVLRVAAGRVEPWTPGDDATGDAEAGEALGTGPDQPPLIDEGVDEDPWADCDPGDLHRALAQVADALGMPHSTPVPAADSTMDRRGFLRLAAAHGLLARAVRCTDPRDWQRAAGPLLAFREGDGAPVVLLPGPTGVKQRLADGTRCGVPLRPAAWSFHLIEAAAGGWRDLLRRAIRAARPDATWALLGGAAVAVPLVLPAMLASIPVSAGPAAFVICALAVSSVLLAQQGHVAATRWWLAIERAAVPALAQRCSHLRLDALRAWSAAQLWQHQSAPGRALRHLRRTLHAAQDAVGLAALLLACAALAPAALPVALGLAGIAVALPVVLGSAVVRARPKAELADFRARRLLQEVLGGLSRLRLLQADSRATDAVLAQLCAARLAANPLRSCEHSHALLALAAPGVAGIVAFASTTGAAAVLLLVGISGLALRCGLAWAAARDVATLHRQAAALLEAGDAVSAADSGAPATLELRDIGFRYPGSADPALRSVSLVLRPGEQVGLTGPSGSGKTTLARIALGLEQAAGGEFRLDGAVADGRAHRAWREQCAWVPQGARLAGATTLRAHVAGSAPVGLQEVWNAVRTVGLAGELHRLPMGLQTPSDGLRLSAGEEQRLAIARELLRGPRLLVLDEATQALDEGTQERLLAQLRARGITVLHITHRESALRCMDRVLVLQEGTLAYDGPPQGLAEEPELRALLDPDRQEGLR